MKGETFVIDSGELFLFIYTQLVIMYFVLDILPRLHDTILHFVVPHLYSIIFLLHFFFLRFQFIFWQSILILLCEKNFPKQSISIQMPSFYHFRVLSHWIPTNTLTIESNSSFLQEVRKFQFHFPNPSEPWLLFRRCILCRCFFGFRLELWLIYYTFLCNNQLYFLSYPLNCKTTLP